MQFDSRQLPPYVSIQDSLNHKKLLEFLPDHPEDAIVLHQALLVACFTGVDLEQVIKSADYIIAHSEDRETRAMANHFKGCVLCDQKKFDEAIPALKSAIEVDPESDSTIGVLAECYMEKHRYDDALGCYHQLEALSLKDGDEYDWLYADLGEAYFMKQDYENAMNYFQKSFDLKNDSVIAVSGLGRVAATTGYHDKALEYFNKGLALDPKDAYNYYYLGQTWQDKNDFYRAMYYYTEALKLKPDFAQVYNNIGALYAMEEGDLKSAIDKMMLALESLEKDDSFHTTVYLNLSKLYRQIADYDKAEYYKAKMMQSIGFSTELDNDDSEEDSEHSF